MLYSKYPPEFITVTCLDWKPLLTDDLMKAIITDSLHFLAQAQRITVYGFVVMQNHSHLIWQMNGEHEREDVERDFLKFTAQQILKSLRNKESPILPQLLVGSKDRKYQVWLPPQLVFPQPSNRRCWQPPLLVFTSEKRRTKLELTGTQTCIYSQYSTNNIFNQSSKRKTRCE